MSVEAISWALNLAPVPADSGDKPNPACAFVLVGLANHADPTGRGAFPSVKTLMRYTRMTKRTVRSALDRLEADGLIRPCDPDIVAANIKRADRRPKGWDLAMNRVRTDLDDDELTSLEQIFPGVTARVMAARGDEARPVVDNPTDDLTRVVDNSTDGGQPQPLVAATGGNHCTNGG